MRPAKDPSSSPSALCENLGVPPRGGAGRAIRGTAIRAFAAVILAAPSLAGDSVGPRDGAPAWVLNDTGQSLCYDDRAEIGCPEPGQPFHGQDAQYGTNRMAFRDNGDSTVTDLTTGLTWTAGFAGRMTWREARDRAATLDAGGHHDWRLPTVKELYSLMDFSGRFGADVESSRPFIDTRVFAFAYGGGPPGGGPPGAGPGGRRFIDAQFWSATRYTATTMLGDSSAFGVNFADGRIKAYPTRFADGREGGAFVRFVRGPIGYGENDFVDQGDGTILDRASGLVWQKSGSPEPLDWKDALAYAENLELGGHDDWRLPNAKELQSIVDYERTTRSDSSGGAIDPRLALAPGDPYYWTSTTILEGPPGRMASAAAYVAFGRALGWMEVPPHSGHPWLLDVHGAGAQRSDLKGGDAAAFPHGRGPQGDVVRIRNYVRCVRG